MFRYIFQNISNTIYSILYSNVDAKLNNIIKHHNNLVKSYNLLKSKYHTYYDLYIELFNDNHKNTIEYNNLVDSYNNLQEKYENVISENKNLKRKLLTNNNRYVRKKLY